MQGSPKEKQDSHLYTSGKEKNEEESGVQCQLSSREAYVGGLQVCPGEKVKTCTL